MLSVYTTKLQKCWFSAFYKLLLPLIQHTHSATTISLSLDKFPERGKNNIRTTDPTLRAGSINCTSIKEHNAICLKTSGAQKEWHCFYAFKVVGFFPDRHPLSPLSTYRSIATAGTHPQYSRKHIKKTHCTIRKLEVPSGYS